MLEDRHIKDRENRKGGDIFIGREMRKDFIKECY